MKALSPHGSNRNLSIGFAVALVVCLVVAFWPTLTGLVHKWSAVPEYSHGYIVPLIALGLLWVRRKHLRLDRLHPSAWGIAGLGAALAFRHMGAYFYYEWFEQLSLVCCTFGIVLLCGGMAAMKWAWPACLFLFFMVPLPFVLEVALRDPLRDIGTLASTYVMQTVGMPAFADGRVIVVGESRVGVEEACSGLGMLMVFFALSTAVAILIDQPIWRRLLIVASALPIALISNIARITAVGSLHAMGYHTFAETAHDHAGFPMMALALILLWIEIAILDRLVIEEYHDPAEIAPPFGLRRKQGPQAIAVPVGRR